MTGAKTTLSFIYWGLVLLVLIVHCYNRGTNELRHLSKTKGVVIDQIYVVKQGMKRSGSVYSTEVLRPQIIFPVDDTSYIFVDHNVALENGDEPTVLFPYHNPRDAKVYRFAFWIDEGFIVPVFLIAVLIYKIASILAAKDEKPYEVLPSNL